MQENTQQTRLIPLVDWPKYHPYPSKGGLRALVFNQHKNGFNKVIRRINYRVLIDEKAFFSWVNELNKIERDE